jgi:putative addiction module component (TIGR02574 family)
MSRKAAELLKEALALPVEERAEMARSLIDSLDFSAGEDVEVAWQEEIARRIAAVRAGRAIMIPREGVRKKARAILHVRKADPSPTKVGS